MEFMAEFLNLFLNGGLLLGMIFGVIILLRPVTTRLLSPSQRVVLWGSGWIVGSIPPFIGLASQISLPFPTLRDILLSRIHVSNSGGLPSFLPALEYGVEDYYLALPGEIAVPIRISGGMITALGIIGIVYLILIIVLAFAQDVRVKKLAESGTLLNMDRYAQLGIEQESKIQVRLCPNLPTSFAIRRSSGHIITLQSELTAQQLRLVFLHEREHVRRSDPWLNGIAAGSLCLYFWNPVVWLAYVLFRRDMELACDQRVLKQLDREGRREYARTLVELASDRPVWGGLTTFGECDAALRVRKAAEWSQSTAGKTARNALGWAVTVLLALFLVAGGPQDKALAEDVALDMERLGVWPQLVQSLEEQQISVDGDAPVWVKGTENYGYCYFQGQDGVWWRAVFGRFPYYNGVIYLDLRPEALPDLEHCRQLDGKWGVLG